MKYDVRTYGDEILRQAANSVEKVTDSIRRLAADMLETMRSRKGVGLAAQQIGRTEAICVVDTSPPPGSAPNKPPSDPDVPMPLVMINPRITQTAGRQTEQEGCLSFPEIFVNVRRAAEVTVCFTDLQGGERTVKGHGLLARAIQHELDHLKGILLVDRMSPVQKVANVGKLRKLKKQSVQKAA